MSHFTVMVKVPNKMVVELGLEDAVAEQLARYQENNMGDCPEEFLEWNDVEEEYKEQFETEETEFILTPDGQLTWPWDYKHAVDGDPFKKEEVIPEGYQRVTRPIKEKYESFERFMEEYAGCEPDEQGRYGYYENPNARWDWYQIGGRWQGALRLKEAAVMEGNAKKGEPSLLAMMNEKRAKQTLDRLNDPHCADVAQFKDIDWEGMDADTDNQIHEFYKDVEEIRRLEAAGEQIGADLSFGARYTAIDAGLVNREDEKGLFTTMKTTFTEEDLLRDYRFHWEWSTYAVIDEKGEWHEKATMGWFGCDNGDQDDTRAWRKFFRRDHLDNTDPDTWIVIVDCHI